MAKKRMPWWEYQKLLRLKLILKKLSRGWEPHDNYGLKTSPRFWRAVFIHFYGEIPTGDTDERWDTLFALGFPLLRELEHTRHL